MKTPDGWNGPDGHFYDPELDTLYDQYLEIEWKIRRKYPGIESYPDSDFDISGDYKPNITRAWKEE